MPPVYDLIVQLPDGLATAPVFAEDSKQAFELGKKLFPGCRLAGVLRDEEDDDENSSP